MFLHHIHNARDYLALTDCTRSLFGCCQHCWRFMSLWRMSRTDVSLHARNHFHLH